MCVRMFLFACVCMYVGFVCVLVSERECVYVCVCVCACVRLCIYVCVFFGVYVYVCVCV
jgi:hypothetical protein